MLRSITINLEGLQLAMDGGNAARSNYNLEPVYLDMIDACILEVIYRRYAYAVGNPRAHMKVIAADDGGGPWVWFAYNRMMAACPMLGLGKDALQRRVNKLLTDPFSLLERCIIAKTMPCFRPGPMAWKLSDTQDPGEEGDEEGGDDAAGGAAFRPGVPRFVQGSKMAKSDILQSAWTPGVSSRGTASAPLKLSTYRGEGHVGLENYDNLEKKDMAPGLVLSLVD
jgi:hypothetical protein